MTQQEANKVPVIFDSLPLDCHCEAVAGVLDHGDNLVVAQLKDLLPVDLPDVVPLLEAGLLGRGVGLDPAQLDGEGLVLAAHDDEAPGLAGLAVQPGVDHLLGHAEGAECGRLVQYANDLKRTVQI